jgi:ferritin-like metal-binding protein YciE
MALASLKDLYFDELGDLCDAETQMLRTLPRLAEAARAPELREALKKHCDESRLHLERLELIFTHWGERRRSKACAGLAGIVQEADERLNQAATDDVRDAAIIGVAQRIEHYEIAAYGCARTYARRLNRLDEARLLQETLDEEGRADHRLTELAESHINDDARLETDFKVPQAGRLQYVPMDVVAQRRGNREPLAIRNDADEELGVLDGLVAESDLGAARYAVVNAGGLVAARRYLLPLRLLRFDDRACVVRVSIDKAVAERYPAFDRDEFDTMSEADRSGYEARLLAFFRRDNGNKTRSDDPIGTLPEWLLKSTWITVPPQWAERLPAGGRSFVNEFAPVPSESVEAPPEFEPIVAHDRNNADVRPRHEETATPPHGDKLR